MKDLSNSLLRSAISLQTSKLDKINFQIKSILEKADKNSTEELDSLFGDLVFVELTLSTMTAYYNRFNKERQTYQQEPKSPKKESDKK